MTEALARRAMEAKAHGQHAEALAALLELETLTGRPEVQIELGEVLFRLNRSEEGLARWLHSGVYAPDGNLLDLPSEAERWQRDSLFDLRLEEAWVRVAEALIGARRFDAAFHAWQWVFERLPDDGVIHRRLTAAFLFCGEVAKADAIYQARVNRSLAEARTRQLDQLGLRFLRDYSTNIGHIGFLDHYVKAGLLGHRAAAQPVVVYGRKPVANPYYLSCWRPHLPRQLSDLETYGRIEGLVDLLEDHTHGYLDAHGEQRITYRYDDYVRVFGQWEAEGRAPLLRLEEEHVERGWDALVRLGVPRGSWFVTLHVREDAWDKVRNATVDTYLPALRAITERGGWVIRMGDASMTPLPALPRVIDYAHSDAKRDAMDIFLFAENRFLLGTNSGPCQVPPTFGKPCVLTNWAPLLTPIMYPSDRCIYKRYFSRELGRCLTFGELTDSGIGYASSAAYLEALGIELIGNSPEEILEVVMEMLEDRRPAMEAPLQRRFRACMEAVGGTNGTIGEAFAERYADLLGRSVVRDPA